MLFGTNKEKGNAGLSMAIAYFGVNGYNVSIPLNDTQDYDLIAEKDNIMERIQVKATGAITKYGTYKLSLRSCGGTKGTTYKTVGETCIEKVFALCEDMTMYLIPFELIKDKKSSINLNKESPKTVRKNYIDWSEFIIKI